jgi:molybdopterin adenylyltransferase
MTAAILVVSDRAFRGERQDASGPAIADALAGFEVVARQIVPDDRGAIAEALMRLADEVGADLILTSGGTGIAPRDVTPEATRDVLDFEIPGLAETMRAKSFDITPTAALSRGVAGARGSSLILNLPGSPKGAVECLQFVLPAIPHAIQLLRGKVSDCA